MQQNFNDMVYAMKKSNDMYHKRSVILWDTPYGKDRRNMIVAYLQHVEAIEKDRDFYRIWVNRRYCPSVPRDKDIQKLIKDGRVKVSRRGGRQKGRGSKQQYLTLKEQND